MRDTGRGGDNDDEDKDCWSLASTQPLFSYIGTDSLCCFCQRLMTKSKGVRMMARKGGPVHAGGTRTADLLARRAACYPLDHPSPIRDMEGWDRAGVSGIPKTVTKVQSNPLVPRRVIKINSNRIALYIYTTVRSQLTPPPPHYPQSLN